MSNHSVNVAVYGTLKQGFPNHPVMGQDAVLLGTCSIEGYSMYDLGAFPACVEGEGSVSAEVYCIPNSQLKSLDYLEGFYEQNSDRNFYNRKVIDTEYGEAWLYLYADENSLENNDLIESGEWT